MADDVSLSMAKPMEDFQPSNEKSAKAVINRDTQASVVAKKSNADAEWKQ